MAKSSIHVRLATRSDEFDVLRIEDATFGDWSPQTFAEVLKEKTVVCYVAFEHNPNDMTRGRVIGFIVLEMGKYSMRVMNMAALSPAARKSLIEKAEKRADAHKKNLVWKEG